MSKSPDAGLDNAEDMPTLTRGEEIAREMGMAGFVRKDDRDSLSKNYVEFTKTFADPTGANGLVTALVKKDAAGIEAETLEGFVLTIQKHVRAIPEDVHTGAWKFAQADMLHLVDVLGAIDEAQTHVVTSKCDRCKKVEKEFVKFGKESLCPACFKETGI